ncbi:MAG TPA: type II secretion system F family protein [Acidimicrobiales bacterium]|nr:type II secretion system F family protein [Acidimicrobiales bacterium]
MSPALTALVLAACVGLAARGLWMVADPGHRERFAPVETGSLPPNTRRASLVAAFFEQLSRRLAGRALRLLGEGRIIRVRRRLEAAGRPGGLTVEGYAGRKAAFTVLMGGAGVLFLARGNLFLFLALTAAGFFWMDAWLAGVARKRQARIERDLPDFVDILAVTITAGVGFRSAMARVAQAVAGPLGEEISRTLRQMDLGASRRAAFEELRRRNSAESLSRMVTSVLQAEELGTPLADVLMELARDGRRAFAQQARRQAARAAPRVSLIITMVIVPGAILLMIVALILGSDVEGLNG